MIVIALLFGLYVISKTDDSEELTSSETSIVDKIWDDYEINESFDEDEVADEPENTSESADSLSKLTVKELKAKLKEKGLRQSGRKAELVARLLATGNSVDMKDKVASAMKSSGLTAVRLFVAIDQTDDGYVSRREIRTAVNTLLKDSVKFSDIDAMLETFDANGDGVISLDEFLSVMEEHQPAQFIPVLPDLKPPKK